jgi:nucleoside-diphosphate-sugar epimerase
MRVAITGGTGFVGRHLARSLSATGHEVMLIARGLDRRDPSAFEIPRACFFPSDLSDPDRLAQAFSACGAVAHCAGINREISKQTYERVHVQGTRNVVAAALRAGVGKLALLSFLRARPGCGSGYHESKWAAEEIVRNSHLDYTIFKAGVIYGPGDHMLDHLSHALHTFPVFALVGFQDKPVRPLAVEDLVCALEASLIHDRMSRQTLAITGPEELLLGDAVRRVARAAGKHPLFVRAPIFVHGFLAWWMERLMKTPLVSRAQLRILSEGIVEPLPPCNGLPEDLRPRICFTEEQIRKGLPEAESFGWKDLRWFA